MGYLQLSELEKIKKRVYNNISQLRKNKVVLLETIIPRNINSKDKRMYFLEKYNKKIKEEYNLEETNSLVRNLMFEIEKEVNDSFLELNWFFEIENKANKDIYIMVDFSAEQDICFFMTEANNFFTIQD